MIPRKIIELTGLDKHALTEEIEKELEHVGKRLGLSFSIYPTLPSCPFPLYLEIKASSPIHIKKEKSKTEENAGT